MRDDKVMEAPGGWTRTAFVSPDDEQRIIDALSSGDIEKQVEKVIRYLAATHNVKSIAYAASIAKRISEE